MTCGDVHLRSGHPHRARPGRDVRPVHRRTERCRVARGHDGRSAACSWPTRMVGTRRSRPRARGRRPTRTSCCPNGSKTRGPDRDRTVRRRVGVAAPLPAQRPHRDPGIVDELCTQAGRSRRTARVRRRDDERAPRRLPRLPAQSAPGRGLVPRGDGGGWAAPCPLLLPLRPPALVAEEIAVAGAPLPGRVGLGVASGALPADFEIMHAPMDDLAAALHRPVEELAGMLDGSRRRASRATPPSGPAPSTRYPS